MDNEGALPRDLTMLGATKEEALHPVIATKRGKCEAMRQSRPINAAEIDSSWRHYFMQNQNIISVLHKIIDIFTLPSYNKIGYWKR
jgi:hypothetical protein